jgi:hypothetical protein
MKITSCILKNGLGSRGVRVYSGKPVIKFLARRNG